MVRVEKWLPMASKRRRCKPRRRSMAHQSGREGDRGRRLPKGNLQVHGKGLLACCLRPRKEDRPMVDAEALRVRPGHRQGCALK